MSITAVYGLVVLALAGPASPADLQSLSDEQLLAEYVRAGLAIPPSHGIPADGDYNYLPGGKENDAFKLVRQEIISRGPKIVPALMEFLKKEVPLRRQPATDSGGIVPGFTRDCIGILGEIGDPRPVGLLLEILDGYDGKATQAKREAANAGLETLTHCTFLTERFNNINGRDLVPHTETIKIDLAAPDKYLPQISATWKKWLAGEGKDPQQWLPLACARARKMIESEDSEAIETAIRFLAPYTRETQARLKSSGRDDQPQATLARMAEIMKDSRKAVNGYEWKGKSVRHPATWLRLMGAYGPVAQSQSKTIIAYLEQSFAEAEKKAELAARAGIAMNQPPQEYDPALANAFNIIENIGGEELVAYMVRCLPRLAAIPDGFSPQGHAACQRAISRWAGRMFATDDEIAKWWETSKDKTQQQWLREGLPVAAAQADGGSHDAIQILYYMLPDLPREYFYPQELAKRPSFAGWVKANAASLGYDENLGGFRLKKP